MRETQQIWKQRRVEPVRKHVCKTPGGYKDLQAAWDAFDPYVPPPLTIRLAKVVKWAYPFASGVLAFLCGGMALAEATALTTCAPQLGGAGLALWCAAFILWHTADNSKGE